MADGSAFDVRFHQFLYFMRLHAFAGGSWLKEGIVEAVVVGQSKITGRGQVTLPKELRGKYGLNAGDTLYFLDVDGAIVLKLGPLILTE